MPKRRRSTPIRPFMPLKRRPPQQPSAPTGPPTGRDVLRALGGVLLLIAFASIGTLLAANYRVRCERVDGVDCTIQRQLFWVIPLGRTQLHDVVDVELYVSSGHGSTPGQSASRGSQGYMRFTTRAASVKELPTLSSYTDVAHDLDSFIDDQRPSIAYTLIGDWMIGVLFPAVPLTLAAIVLLAMLISSIRRFISTV